LLIIEKGFQGDHIVSGRAKKSQGERKKKSNMLRSVRGKDSGWKPTHLTSVFALRTSILLPDGTTLMAFADVSTDVAGCSIGWFPPTS